MNGFKYGGSMMYELQHLTDERGQLVVQQGRDSLYDEADASFYVCSMDWGSKDAGQLDEEFTAVCRALQNLAEIYRMGQIPFGSCPASEGVMPDSPEMKAWSIYLREADAPVAQLKDMGSNVEVDNSEEVIKEALEKGVNFAEERIGRGACCIQTLKTWEHGWSYCKVHALRFPSIMVKMEEEEFAVDYALHACAKEIKFVNLILDHYDPKKKLFGEVNDAEMAQLLRLLEEYPHLFPDERAGYLLLMNSLFARDRAKLCDLTFHEFDRVKKFCDGLLEGLQKWEAECLCELYGLKDGVRRSETEVGATCGISGLGMYEIKSTALRRLRYSSRLEKISGLLM